jgi:cell division protein ZapE
MSLTLDKTYSDLVNQQEIVDDPSQRRVLPYLQAILQGAEANQQWWRRLLHLTQPVKGLYFYGGVGVGKTFMMDLFFAAFPGKRKVRKHFHEFMRDVHEAMKSFEGQSDPLMRVALSIAKEIDLLCLDECVVNDIGDAMILERLFATLFKQKVLLVTTSNFAPDDLYLDGLHRKRFLGAISLIKRSCTILPVLSKQDHRKALFERAGTFLTPLGEETETVLGTFFRSFSAQGEKKLPLSFELSGRMLQAKARSAEVIWFDFKTLCASPRSQLDYLKLAEEYTVFIVSNVPAIAEDDLSSVTYFILLIDVIYDKGRALILSAEKKAEALYPETGKKAFEYQRTLSRLKEMGSKHYLAQALENANENHS